MEALCQEGAEKASRSRRCARLDGLPLRSVDTSGSGCEAGQRSSVRLAEGEGSAGGCLIREILALTSVVSVLLRSYRLG